MRTASRRSGLAISLGLAILLGSIARVSAEELLTNGSFDAGSVGWVEDDGGTGYGIITPAGQLPSPISPQTVPYVAWLGGLFNVTEYLYQTVTVPPAATGLQVQGYIWIQTEEHFGGIYDLAALRLVSTGGATLETLKTWNNTDETTGWTAFSFPVLGNYAGQTVRLRFESHCDASWNTNFFFDTIHFNATVATAAPEIAAARSWGSVKNLYR